MGKLWFLPFKLKLHLWSYVLHILEDFRYAVWVNSYNPSVLLKKPRLREDRFLEHDLSFMRAELGLECVSSKPVLHPGLLCLLQWKAFHCSLKDDMHYGHKVLDFSGLFHQPDSDLPQFLLHFQEKGPYQGIKVLRSDRGI